MRTIVSSELLTLAPTAWKKTGNVSEDGQREFTGVKRQAEPRQVEIELTHKAGTSETMLPSTVLDHERV